MDTLDDYRSSHSDGNYDTQVEEVLKSYNDSATDKIDGISIINLRYTGKDISPPVVRRRSNLNMRPAGRGSPRQRTPQPNSFGITTTGNWGRSREHSRRTSSRSSDKNTRISKKRTLGIGPINFLMDIFYSAFLIIKKPLAWLLALYMLILIVGLSIKSAQNLIYSALSPLCKIPGIGVFGLPFCDNYSHRKSYVQPAKGMFGSEPGSGRAEFPKFMELQASFEDLLDSSASGSVMAQDLKNSEVAVRDLNTLVKYSELLCKDILSSRLDDFVIGAKTTSVSLIKFSSGVRGVVDLLIAMDEYAISSLETIKNTQDYIYSSSTANKILVLLLSPLGSRFNVRRAEHEVYVKFVQAGSAMDTSIKKLILEAVNALAQLNELDQKLFVIDEIVQQESFMLDEKNRETLAQIWTILGGNRDKLENFHNHRALLSNLRVYRTKALAHISASLLQLQTMQANLEELRDKVAQPSLLGSDGDWIENIPLEVHIQSIRKGVERLSDGIIRAKSKELSHMQGILQSHDKPLISL